MALDVAAAGRPVNGRRVIEPRSILGRLVVLDAHLDEELYYSERAVFYNPGRSAPLGAIFAAIKDHDGPNDKRSRLSRPGVFRFAFQLPRREYDRHFGPAPPRPAKGRSVTLEQDPSVLDELTPHPVYAWMRWVQVLCPTQGTFDSLLPLLEESLESVRTRWDARSAPR